MPLPSFGKNLRFLCVLLLTCTQFACSDKNATLSQPHDVTANAGTNQSVISGVLVTLQGSGTDGLGHGIRYNWQQISGPSVTLSDPNVQNPTFTAPVNFGDLVFELIVDDGAGVDIGKSISSTPSNVTITITNTGPIITSVTITPAIATRAQDLTVTVVASDHDGQSLSYSYKWTVNSVEVIGETNPTLTPANFVKTDLVAVIVTVSDGELQAVSNASVTIEDAPPVLSDASAPTTATYGTPVSFSLVASDADGVGDPANISLVLGPMGMVMDAFGTITWTPKTPMFEKTATINWSIESTPAATSYQTLSGTIELSDPTRELPLARSGSVVPSHNEGTVIADLDNDGITEILISDNYRLFTLVFDGADYVQNWFYPFAPCPEEMNIRAITSLDIDADNQWEIFVACGGISSGANQLSELRLLAGASREISVSAQLNASDVRDIQVADVDGDGKLEVVVLVEDFSGGGFDNRKLQVLDATTLVMEWESLSLLLGDSLAIGNVDNDAALEIVTGEGYVYGYNGASAYATEWQFGSEFGFDVEVGDLDGDGVDEIVAALDWTAMRVFSAVSKSMLVEVIKDDMADLTVGDIDADGFAEILLGDGQFGNVTAYSFVSTPSPALTEEWTINSANHGVTSIRYGDVDNDGAVEFMWGGGTTSSGADTLQVAGLNPTIAIEWTNASPKQLDGPFTGGHWLTLGVADNKLVFASATTDAGYSGTRLISMDTVSGDLGISAELATNWNNQVAITGADFDADSVDEVFSLVSALYDPFGLAYDFNGDVSEWNSATTNGVGKAVVAGDMNGDSQPDMVFVTDTGFVYVFDVLTATMLWSLDIGSANGEDIELADIDADGVFEIIVAASDKVNVYQKSGGSYTLLNSVTVTAVVDLAIADLDKDGKDEIVAGAQALGGSSVYVLDSDLSTVSSYDVVGDLVTLTVEDDGTDVRNLLLGIYTGGLWPSLGYLMVVDLMSGNEVMRSPMLPGYPGHNSVHYVDTDGDGEMEISYGTNYSMNKTR